MALGVDRFERVVLNLLGNAIKYTDAGKGAEFTVRLPAVSGGS